MTGEWRRSSFCGNTTCVEVAHDETTGSVRVRNSWDPDRQLLFSAAEWEAFRLGMLAGEFRWDGDGA